MFGTSRFDTYSEPLKTSSQPFATALARPQAPPHTP